MEVLLKVAALGILAALLITVLKKQSPDTALLLSLTVCVLIALLLLDTLKPLLRFFEKLHKQTGLQTGLLAPMAKSVGIGLLTQISSAVCADAGQGAIARLIELCGGVLALSVALPLFEAVLELIGSIGGGG